MLPPKGTSKTEQESSAGGRLDWQYIAPGKPVQIVFVEFK
jgi:hypothetical protein